MFPVFYELRAFLSLEEMLLIFRLGCVDVKRAINFIDM